MKNQTSLRSHSDEIAGIGAIGTIYLSLPVRPSYRELSRLRQRAVIRDRSVSLIGDSLTIRPSAIPMPIGGAEPHPHATAIRFSRHFGPWMAELRSLSEGTR
jgi:hypothetical protein